MNSVRNLYIMKNIILVTIIAIFTTSCSVADKSKYTIVCGEVINAEISSPKVVTVFPYDFITDSNDRLATDISQNDFKFHQKFTMTHRHDVAINYNGEFYTLMAEPSDSIFVTIDAKDNSILPRGSKEHFNTQLNMATKIADSVYSSVYEFNLDTDVEGLISQLKQKLELTKDALAQYDFDDDVKSYVMCNALYSFANNLIRYDRANKYSPERFNLLTHEIFDIYNPCGAQSYMYAVHIVNLLNDFMISNSTTREEVFKDEQDITKLSQLFLTNILEQPKSLMRDIFLAQLTNMLQGSLDEVNDVCKEQLLSIDNYYNAKFLEFYVLPKLQPQPLDSPKTLQENSSIKSEVKYINKDYQVEGIASVDIMDYIIEKYSGKVIYIDVWATWCGPCILEMKYAKKLHAMYKSNEDVVFVNICLSSKFEEWTKSIEENAIDGENYFIQSDDVAKMIMSTYNLPGYPSFLLINNEGEVVTTSAFRPSQLGELSMQLEAQF